MPNRECQRLTTPLKCDVIDDWQRSYIRTIQLTRQNQFTRSFSSQAAIKWRMAVVYAVRVSSRCHGCEVESGESTETHSPDEACRGWRMANDSTRSSAMSDVFVVLFTFLVHFWLVIHKSDPHWLFTKWSSFELSLAGQTLLAPLDVAAPLQILFN